MKLEVVVGGLLLINLLGLQLKSAHRGSLSAKSTGSGSDDDVDSRERSSNGSDDDDDDDDSSKVDGSTEGDHEEEAPPASKKDRSRVDEAKEPPDEAPDSSASPAASASHVVTRDVNVPNPVIHSGPKRARLHHRSRSRHGSTSHKSSVDMNRLFALYSASRSFSEQHLNNEALEDILNKQLMDLTNIDVQQSSIQEVQLLQDRLIIELQMAVQVPRYAFLTSFLPLPDEKVHATIDGTDEEKVLKHLGWWGENFETLPKGGFALENFLELICQLACMPSGLWPKTETDQDAMGNEGHMNRAVSEANEKTVQMATSRYSDESSGIFLVGCEASLAINSISENKELYSPLRNVCSNKCLSSFPDTSWLGRFMSPCIPLTCAYCEPAGTQCQPQIAMETPPSQDYPPLETFCGDSCMVEKDLCVPFKTSENEAGEDAPKNNMERIATYNRKCAAPLTCQYCSDFDNDDARIAPACIDQNNKCSALHHGKCPNGYHACSVPQISIAYPPPDEAFTVDWDSASAKARLLIEWESGPSVHDMPDCVALRMLRITKSRKEKYATDGKWNTDICSDHIFEESSSIPTKPEKDQEFTEVGEPHPGDFDMLLTPASEEEISLFFMNPDEAPPLFNCEGVVPLLQHAQTPDRLAEVLPTVDAGAENQNGEIFEFVLCGGLQGSFMSPVTSEIWSSSVVTSFRLPVLPSEEDLRSPEQKLTGDVTGQELVDFAKNQKNHPKYQFYEAVNSAHRMVSSLLLVAVFVFQHGLK